MSKATIKAEIDANITQNGTGAITGNILNGVLNDMVGDYAESSELNRVLIRKSNLADFSNRIGYYWNASQQAFINVWSNQYVGLEFHLSKGDTLRINSKYAYFYYLYVDQSTSEISLPYIATENCIVRGYIYISVPSEEATSAKLAEIPYSITGDVYQSLQDDIAGIRNEVNTQNEVISQITGKTNSFLVFKDNIGTAFNPSVGLIPGVPEYCYFELPIKKGETLSLNQDLGEVWNKTTRAGIYLPFTAEEDITIIGNYHASDGVTESMLADVYYTISAAPKSYTKNLSQMGANSHLSQLVEVVDGKKNIRTGLGNNYVWYKQKVHKGDILVNPRLNSTNQDVVYIVFENIFGAASYIDNINYNYIKVMDEGTIYISLYQSTAFDYNKLVSMLFYYSSSADNHFFSKDKVVVCWGDSLTGDDRYEQQLYKNLNAKYAVINEGIGGDTAQGIASRQGGLKLIFKNDVSLPSGTSSVEIGRYGDMGLQAIGVDGESINVGWTIRQTIASSNVFVNGIPCMLRWTGNSYTDPNGRWTISRKIAGTAYTIKAGDELITYGQKLSRNVSVNIIYAGTNNSTQFVSTDLIPTIKNMIECSNGVPYVVIGLHSWTGDLSVIEGIEKQFKGAFGQRFLDFRRYLVEHALSDYGVTPTEADQIAIAQGKCPPSLLADGLHFNDLGYRILGDKVYERIKELGDVE